MARKKKNKEPKRTVRLKFDDGSHKDLEIAFGVSMKSSKTKNDKRFYLEQMEDGRYKMVWSEDLIENMPSLQGMEIIRED